ncbi:MAG: hypothetical protein C0617_03535 [Desulfuromonas sp.]|uniref:hypothetical protein n=1 Tax=Desulfuromonas sp. TaxID=892 RepID=UPI000CAE1728|nr:hypothetical protein [Desulfuromonas sp.]PLX85581.1 MAG: hypothetical protein C0617_03535 [Desulfuromonas sp.]
MKTSTTRPLSVCIISWFTIFYALLSAAPKLFLLINPEAYRLTLEWSQAASGDGLIPVPFSFQLVHALVGVPVLLFSGVFMLKGRTWALAAFLFWIFGVLVLTFLVSGLSVSLYLKLAVAVIATVLLTREKALAFFASQGADRRTP